MKTSFVFENILFRIKKCQYFFYFFRVRPKIQWHLKFILKTISAKKGKFEKNLIEKFHGFSFFKKEFLSLKIPWFLFWWQNLKRGILFWKSFFWGGGWKKGWFRKCFKKNIFKIFMGFFLKKEKKKEISSKAPLFLWWKKTCKYFHFLSF